MSGHEFNDADGQSEWRGLRVRLRHQTVEAIGLIAILVQDAVILLAGFLAEFAYERWLHSESPFFRIAVNISSGLFLLLYVVTVTVHVVHYVREQVGVTSAQVSAWWRPALAGLALVGAAVLSTALVMRGGSPVTESAESDSRPLTEMRVEVTTPAADDPAAFALSPDGRELVFVASSDGASRLWLRSLVTATAEPLAGTEGARAPFWSPDSRSIGFFATGSLKRLDLGGGAPRILAPAINGQGGTWNADGVIVFAPARTTPLMRVLAAGGDVTAVTAFGARQSGHTWPFFLPDGHRLVFRVQGTPDSEGIYLGALDGGSLTRLTPSEGSAVYLPASRVSHTSTGASSPSGGKSGDGWLAWVRAGALVAQRLDLAQASLTGEVVTLTAGEVPTNDQRQSAIAAAATGLIAYRTGGVDERQLTWVDRTGAARGTVGSRDANNLATPRISPDGRQVVVDRFVQGHRNLWIIEGARTTRFTFGAAWDWRPVWSLDGSRIVFRSARSGPGDLYQKSISGGGNEELILKSDEAKNPYGWSADGRTLLYGSITRQGDSDLWTLPMTGDRTPSVFLKTPFREVYPVVSPDGVWVAYQSDESGRPEVYVRSLSGTETKEGVEGRKWQVSTNGGVFPVWRRDGKELYYLSPTSAMMAASVTSGRGAGAPTLELGAPVELFRTRIFGGGADFQQGRQYDVGADGRFLINMEVGNAVSAVTLLMNWHPEGTK